MFPQFFGDISVESGGGGLLAEDIHDFSYLEFLEVVLIVVAELCEFGKNFIVIGH